MSYETYLEMKKKYAESKTEEIEYVNKHEIPQNVLWQKEVASKFVNDKAKFETINDQFYFTEELVNKLMHFSFLMGTKELNEKSYKNGWNDCFSDVKEKLGIVEHDESEF